MTKSDSNACKGIAIIMMLAHHLFYDVYDIAQLPIKYGFIISNFDNMNMVGFLGKMCVSVFTFLSGYGIAKSIQGRKFDFTARDVYGKIVGTRFIKLLLSFQLIFILSMIPAAVRGDVLGVYGGDNNWRFVHDSGLFRPCQYYWDADLQWYLVVYVNRICVNWNDSNYENVI